MGKVDLEVLKNQQGNLTDAQQEEIALATLAEIEEEEKGKKPDKEELPEKKEESTEEQEKTDEDILNAEDKDLSEAELAKKKELTKVKEDELLNAKDEDLDDDKKVKKVGLIKAREEEKRKSEEQELETYAKENNVSVEEAKQDIESIGKIREKYKDDTKQLAKSNLHLQRLYTKAQEENKTLKEVKPQVQQKEVSTEDIIKLIDDGNIKLNGKPAPREKIIEAYRENYPDITEEISDESVIKLAAKEIVDNFKQSQVKFNEELSVKAKEKRIQLLSSIPENDKKYLPELRTLIEKVSDNAIMSENFSLEHYIFWAKGKNYGTDIKEAEERGYKRGKEEAEIISVKKPAEGKAPKPKPKQILTTQQKERALEMYGDNMAEQEAYDAYIDYLKDEET